MVKIFTYIIVALLIMVMIVFGGLWVNALESVVLSAKFSKLCLTSLVESFLTVVCCFMIFLHHNWAWIIGMMVVTLCLIVFGFWLLKRMHNEVIATICKLESDGDIHD